MEKKSRKHEKNVQHKSGSNEANGSGVENWKAYFPKGEVEWKTVKKREEEREKVWR